METHAVSWQKAFFNQIGILEFEVEHEFTDAELESLKAEINEADDRFPWRINGRPCRTMGWAARGKFVFSDSMDHGKCYTVRCQPNEFQLKLGQVVAFYNYVLNLAHVIAIMGVTGVRRVSGSVELHTVYADFYPPRR